MFHELPWDLARHLPWSHFTSPWVKWASQPSFVIGEYVFIACAIAAFVHAWMRGRKYLLVWVAALIAGTANDMIFMALPLVDNFWQAQATIMITPRLPLYICCVYVCFMYYATVSVWRLGLPPFAQAALTGLVAELFYGPYDIVGAKFSWWTWHDTDMPIVNRILGVPVGSTMWVITFAAVFAFLLNAVIKRDPEVRPATFAKGLALVAALSSLLMVVQMTVLQVFDDGIPGVRGLCVVIAVYLGLVYRGWSKAQPQPAVRVDRVARGAVIGYFSMLVLVMAAFDPATHVNESLHQTYGRCHVEAKDITGNTRYEFLCVEDYDEDFTFDCPAAQVPEAGATWYTVCARPHTDFRRWMLTILLLSTAGIVVFSYLFGAFGRAARR